MNSQSPQRIELNEVDAQIACVAARRIEVVRVANEGPEGRRLTIQRKRVTDLEELLDAEKARLGRMEQMVADAGDLVDEYDAQLKKLRSVRVAVSRRALIERMQKMHAEMVALGMGDPAAVSEESIS